jgi:hypothetical protein
MKKSKMENLIGCRIREIWISDDQHYICFAADGENVNYKAVGDCCSESWFADLINVPALLNGKVLSIEEIDMPEDGDDGRTRQEHDEVYGYKINTDRGSGKVIFRCSSNGFYGGWIETATDDDILKQSMIQVCDDFSS